MNPLAHERLKLDNKNMKSRNKILFISLTLVSWPLCLSNSPAPWQGPVSLDTSSFVFSSSLIKNDLGDDGCYYSVKVKNSGPDYIASNEISSYPSFSVSSSSTKYLLELDNSLFFPVIPPDSSVIYRSETFAKGSEGYSLDISGVTFSRPHYVFGYQSSSFIEGISISSNQLTREETTTNTSTDSSSSVSTRTTYYEKIGINNASTKTINSAIFVFSSSQGETAFYSTFNSTSPNQSSFVTGNADLLNISDSSITFSKAYFLARNSYYDTNHNFLPNSKSWWWLYLPLYILGIILALQLFSLAIVLPIMHAKNKKKKSNS